MKTKTTLVLIALVVLTHLSLQNQINAAFPDNANTTWVYKSIENTTIEVSPISDDIGYKNLKFTLDYQGIQECLVLENGTWYPLFAR